MAPPPGLLRGLNCHCRPHSHSGMGPRFIGPCNDLRPSRRFLPGDFPGISAGGQTWLLTRRRYLPAGPPGIFHKISLIVTTGRCRKPSQRRTPQRWPGCRDGGSLEQNWHLSIQCGGNASLACRRLKQNTRCGPRPRCRGREWNPRANRPIHPDFVTRTSRPIAADRRVDCFNRLPRWPREGR
jgi:hypothetical protein